MAMLLEIDEALIAELRVLVLDVLWLRRTRPRRRDALVRMVDRLSSIGSRLEVALRSAGDHAQADEVQRICRIEESLPAAVKA